jgi:hypothetical protein
VIEYFEVVNHKEHMMRKKTSKHEIAMFARKTFKQYAKYEKLID